MRKHDMTNIKDKDKDNDKDNDKDSDKDKIHLENTFKEQSLRILNFETFNQSDEET